MKTLQYIFENFVIILFRLLVYFLFGGGSAVS